MSAAKPTRRAFIKHTGLWGLGCALGLAGCGDGKPESAAKTAVSADPCTDLSNLSEADLALRDTDFGSGL